MITIEEAKEFIDENILHSELWDKADAKRRTKAVNNAARVLLNILPDKISDKDDLEVEDVATQAVWMLKIDDSFQRAEMGVQQMTVDGVTILFRNKDNTVAPEIASKYGISLTNGLRRRTGSYRIPHSSNYRIPVANSDNLARKRV